MDSEYRYESEKFEPRLTFKNAVKTDVKALRTSQTLIAWLPVLLFVFGGLLIFYSKSLAFNLVESHQSGGMTSWSTEDLADKSVSLKIIGAGAILYGTALLARRPAKD